MPPLIKYRCLLLHLMASPMMSASSSCTEALYIVATTTTQFYSFLQFNNRIQTYFKNKQEVFVKHKCLDNGQFQDSPGHTNIYHDTSRKKHSRAI